MSMGRHRRHRPGDDRLLAATRWTAIAIVPFLVVAVAVLFAAPDRSGELFAWPIAPPMSAFLLASAYLGGIAYFVGVWREHRWHRVRHGLPAVLVFAASLLVVTLLHLDRFSPNLPFAVWLVLYATTPAAMVALLVLQREADAGRPDTAEVAVPRGVRLALAAIGLGALVAGAAALVAPSWIAEVWAWQLTPLTARVTGAVLTLTGVVNLAMLRDERWSAFRILFGAQLLSLAAIIVALLLRRDDLLWDRPLTVPFLALIALAAIAYSGVTAWGERRLRAARA
ncbi:MAG: hypothetical protein ACQEWM_09970 [Actinomycetota bacterium]